MCELVEVPANLSKGQTVQYQRVKEIGEKKKQELHVRPQLAC